jgi:hypothetical protein
MDFQENLLTDLDDDLKQIKNLKWLPWIGKNYSKTRTIILGESQYEDGHWWEEDNIDATRTLIGKRFSGDRGKLYSNVEKILLAADNPTQIQGINFWKSVAYWNLVPRLMSSRSERPNDKDFNDGWRLFFDLVEALDPKPTTCIVLGKSSCGRLGYYLTNNDTSWDKNNPEFYEKEKIINLSKGDNKLKLIFLNHPSGSFGFDTKYWTKLVSDNEVNLQHLLLETDI